jgi:plasmid stabilization system protein ParE
MSATRRRRLRWHEAALDDLENIVDHIAQEAPLAAERFAQAILTRVEILAETPLIGPACPHCPRTRQIVHGSYLIYYTVSPREVVIRAVVHGARLFQRYWLLRRVRPRRKRG